MSLILPSRLGASGNSNDLALGGRGDVVLTNHSFIPSAMSWSSNGDYPKYSDITVADDPSRTMYLPNQSGQQDLDSADTMRGFAFYLTEGNLRIFTRQGNANPDCEIYNYSKIVFPSNYRVTFYYGEHSGGEGNPATTPITVPALVQANSSVHLQMFYLDDMQDSGGNDSMKGTGAAITSTTNVNLTTTGTGTGGRGWIHSIVVLEKLS